jgi:hypothetical protein
LNVGSLQALGAADNLEFNGLALVERAIAVRLDGGEMDENVLASLALDETKALAGVKPLDCTLFFHKCSFSKLKLSDALFFRDLLGKPGVFRCDPDTAVKRAGNKKRPQVEACGALKQKAKQEQQTQ